jgi:hypothetical protein
MSIARPIIYHPDISDRFLEILVGDKAAFIHDWMVTRQCQDKRSNRGVYSPEGQIQDFYQYHGLCDLLCWFNWPAHHLDINRELGAWVLPWNTWPISLTKKI